MIVHIFTAERYHLVPSISKGFATVYSNDAENLFILYGNAQLDRQLYINLFSQVGFRNFVFCHTFWQLVKLIFRYRKRALLFHAGNYSWHLVALLLGSRNVNWVCWGGGTSISKSKRSRLGALLKKYMFNNYRSIVTLMEPERKMLIDNFGVNPNKIHTISYASTNVNETVSDLFCKELSSQGSNNSDKPVVLLGNSHYWISSYIDMLQRLKKYQGKIKVQCMLNYDFEKGEKYNMLISLGKSIFGDDFKTNEEFYSVRKDYINYMNSCDIYICSVEKQTGLGAISTCLRLGKKIYITGNNFEWVRQEYKSIVFPTDIINEKLSFEEFVKPLSLEEKKHNYQNRVCCRERNREKWHNYLREIESL